MTPLADEKKFKSFNPQYIKAKRIPEAGNAELYCEPYGNKEGSPVQIINNFFIIAPLRKNFRREPAKHHPSSPSACATGCVHAAEGPIRVRFPANNRHRIVKLRGTDILFAHIFPLIYSDRTIKTGGTPLPYERTNKKHPYAHN